MSVNIRIDDRYSIKSDNWNYVLYEHTPAGESAKKEEYEKPIAYCHKLEKVLDALLERKLKTSNAESIHDLKELVREIQSDFRNVLQADGAGA